MAATTPRSGPSPVVRRWHWLVVAAASAVTAGNVIAAGVMAPALRAAAVPDFDSSSSIADDLAFPLTVLLLTLLGGVVVLRGRPQRYGWLMLAAGVLISIVDLASVYGLYAWYVVPDAGLPLDRAAGWVQDLWMILFVFSLLLLPALFPDGHPVGRWRRAVPVVAWAWGVLITVFMLSERPLTNRFLEVPSPPSNPIGILPVPEEVVNTVWVLVMMASVVVGVGSLITRWRTSDTELRQRLKWVLYAFGLLGFLEALVMVDTVLVEGEGIDLGLTAPLDALTSASGLLLVIALGFGVLRYRLYDVDLVINRTVVYGIMTALVAAAYVAVVVGVGALVPTGGNLGLSLLAAAIVAVAFNPVRNRVQQVVNRVMFGRRDDPYAVLSELGRLLAQSGEPDATLHSLVQTVAEALKLPGVAFELEQDGTWETRASVGHLGDDVETIELRHQGELVGRMVVARRSVHEGLHADDRRLLEDVAHQAAGLADTMRLTQALQRSREQLVLAHEEERRRLAPRPARWPGAVTGQPDVPARRRARPARRRST